jgi:hypothetical protein
MSTLDLQSTVLLLARKVSRLTELMSPWIGMDEMCKRYDVTAKTLTAKTLTAMERRGEIPYRITSRWNRSELQQWEQQRSA